MERIKSLIGLDSFILTRVWMPARDALFRPWTPGLLEMTTTISAELDRRLAWSISACRLVPVTTARKIFPATTSCAKNVQSEKQDTHLFQISAHQLWSSCEVHCCSGWRPSLHYMQVLLAGGCALGFAPPQVLPLQFLNKSSWFCCTLHQRCNKEHTADQYEFISHQAAYGPVIRRSRLPSSLHEVGGGPSEHWWATPPALPPGHSWRCGSSPPHSVLPPCRARKTQKGCSTETHLSRRVNVSKAVGRAPRWEEYHVCHLYRQPVPGGAPVGCSLAILHLWCAHRP